MILIIKHTQKYVRATGYRCGILYGSMTDMEEVLRCEVLNRSLQSSLMTVVNYRKDGSMFTNCVITNPIRGAYMSNGMYVYPFFHFLYLFFTFIYYTHFVDSFIILLSLFELTKIEKKIKREIPDKSNRFQIDFYVFETWRINEIL